MSDSPWRVNRRFEVSRDCTDVISGRRYVKGLLYEVQAFNMFRQISKSGEALTRLWQSNDDERYMLLQYIIWDDDRPSKISNGLRQFIKQAPTSKLVRGFLRQEIGIVPEKSKTPTTYDGWMEFIDKVETVIRAPSAPPPEDEPEQTVEVEMTGHERVFGHMNFRRTDRWAGVIEVPASIIEQGERAVVTHIMAHYKDWLSSDPGEDVEHFDRRVTDSDGLVFDQTNIREAIEAYRAGRLPEAPPVRAADQRDLQQVAEMMVAAEGTTTNAEGDEGAEIDRG